MTMGIDDMPVVRLRRAVVRTADHVRERPATGRGHDDADDAVGTIGTDDAVGFDPIPLLEALDARGVHAVVIGQVAGILHGSTELTGDLDILWDGDPAVAEAVADVFTRFDARLTDDDGEHVVCDIAAFLRPKVQFHTAAASGDLCTPALAWGDLDVVSFMARAEVTTTAAGHAIRYLAREDLVAMRRAVGRAKDLRRADELERMGRIQ
jgi:hypothetical protein